MPKPNQNRFWNLCMLAFAWTCTVHAHAQIQHFGEPMHWNESIQPSLNWRTFAPLDVAALEAEDAVTATFKDAPWRFGIEHEVNWTMQNSGTWSEEDGMNVWRLAVRSPGTVSWSFYLSRFVVPKGGELFVWNGNRTHFIGAFNHLNIKEWEGLALSLIEGEAAVIEYRQPVNLELVADIAVGQIVQGYRSLLRRQEELVAANAAAGPFGNSGACNINVNCPEGDDWQVENQSVALIVNGGFAACSGALVNNTANDGTPYFLTANHCLGNPNSWTYYFNHESSTCSGSTGPTNNSISGGTLLVADGGSDVALIELSSTPPASWNVEYAGWDASSANPTSAVGIHHPSGDVKKICFEDDAPYESSTGGAQVWWIDAWELGVTEPGSSGSPLFNQDHRIIGQLYGGAAACSGSVNNGSFDYYGRFDVSWGLGVSQYLDPTGSGTLVLDGYPTGFNTDDGCTNPAACNYSPEAINDDGSCAVNDDCGVCGGDNSTCSGCTNPVACNYDPDATIEDGSCISGSGITVAVGGGSYDSEIGWSIELNGEVFASGDAGTFEACVPEGCLTFVMTDSYGDGWNGASYTLTDDQGSVLASGDLNSAEEGDGSTQGSDLVQIGVASCGYGCTDDSACNYSPDALIDDGSCTFDCNGCTDPSACNYDPAATQDDGSCILGGEGLTVVLLTDNYPQETSWSLSDDNGTVVATGGPYETSAVEEVTLLCLEPGCYSFTVNDSYGDGICCAYGNGSYTLTLGGNVLATGGDFADSETTEFCIESGIGCTDSDACNYEPNATTDDGSCEYNSCLGCTDQAACNYDANATLDDGTCVSPYDVVYIDEDGDGYGGTAIADWCPPLESWTVFQSGDCNDGNAAIHPNAPGTGEGIDNNCNGVIDPTEQVPAPCPEDVNGDGTISVADVLAVLSEFGCASSCEYDVTGDGNVNVTDVLQLLSAFGTDCP